MALQPIIRFPYGAPFEFCLSLYSILHTRYSHFPLFLNNLPHFTLHLLNNLSPFGCQEKPKASPIIISGSPGVRGRGMAIKPAMIKIDPVTTLAAWATLSMPSRYPNFPPRNIPRRYCLG